MSVKSESINHPHFFIFFDFIVCQTVRRLCFLLLPIKKLNSFVATSSDQARVINALTVDVDAAQVTDQERHQVRFYKKSLLITHIDTLQVFDTQKNVTRN